MYVLVGTSIIFRPSSSSLVGPTFTPSDPKHFVRSVKGNRTVYLPPSGPGFYLEVADRKVWVRWVGVEGVTRTPYDQSFTSALKAL